MGVYVFSRDVLLDILAGPARRISAARSFRRRSASYQVNAFLFRGYWADVGTISPSTTRTSC